MARYKAGATHCPRGHEKSESNTDKYGRCKACIQAYTKARSESIKAKGLTQRQYNRTLKPVTTQQDGYKVVKDRQMTEKECWQHLWDFTRIITEGFAVSGPVIHYTEEMRREYDATH